MKNRTIVSGILSVVALWSGAAAWAESLPHPPVILAQIPYDAPPKAQEVPDVSVPPNTNPLSPEELKRAEALLPLLEGKQEFLAMGELVHLG